MILVLFRDLICGGGSTIIVLVMTAPADRAVMTPPTSVVHPFWATVLAATGSFVVLLTHPCWFQVSSAAGSIMFMTKAIMKRIVFM